MTTNCSNNYGPYQFPEKLIPLLICKTLKLEPIPIYGDGLQTRDWLYVEDHCDAILEVLQGGKIGDVYNIGGSNEKTNLEVVNTICEYLDKARPPSSPHVGSYKDLISFVPDRPGHDRRYAIDAKKISKQLGWVPRETFESGLKKTVDWYLCNQIWVDLYAKRNNNSGQLNLNILLLGAGGQLGFDLEHELTEIGSVFKPPHRELDITHEESLKVFVQRLAPDVIVKAAAYTAVDKAEHETELANLTNSIAVSHLAKISKQVGCWLIHFSTDYVFDG